jgi:cytochrome c nitrite reductase small subunit
MQPFLQANRGLIIPTLLAVSSGLFIGLGVFTFGYARGSAYLTNDPAACANCHVMREQYDGWLKASHRKAAVCNDCHTPSGFVPKYFTKAQNGFWHSFYFTTGWYPENIRLRPRNVAVTEAACLKCHADIVDSIHMGRSRGAGPSCINCHRNVGHLQ